MSDSISDSISDPIKNGPKAQPRILLVDDDPHSLESTRKILELAGYTTLTATDGQAALDAVRAARSGSSGTYDLVVTDVRMPRLGGLEFLRALSLCGETTPVVLMTAFGRVEDAVWAMKFGAVDFLTKPFKRQALISSVENALKRSPSLRGEGRASGGAAGAGPRLVGQSPALNRLRAAITQIAASSSTVLLTGESGTGKELVARAIHDGSPRAREPFVAINCAAVPESLIESELFGHDKGAFTGALQAKVGLFEAADGGTLLLDEIGDMPLVLQAKLLRVIQEGEIRRVGSTQSRRVDVRVVAATHRDLKAAVLAGAFRQDLLYRLEVIGLHLPPLRERAGDVAVLARHFSPLEISPETLVILEAHSWPGNVRELSNVLERAAVFARGPKILPEDLPEHLRGLGTLGQLDASGRFGGSREISVPVGTSLKDVEDLMIRKTLEATDGDKNMTAKLLGINSRTIYRKLEKDSENKSDAEL